MTRAALSIAFLLLAPLAGARADWTIGVTGDRITVAGNDIQGAWSPLDLGAALTLWLDAKDAGTLTLSNDFVAAWADKSGNEKHTAQNVLELRRKYLSSDAVANNNPSVSSDSKSRKYVTSPVVVAHQMFIVAAYRDGNDASFDDYATMITGDNVNSERVGMGNPGSVPSGLWFLSNVLSPGAAKNTATNLSTTALPMPLCVLRFDLLQPNTNTWRIGSQHSVGAPTRGWEGPICEVVFVGETLSDSSRISLVNYLMEKWGIE